ncbi:MAG: hypothetical protein GY717_07515 [Rhodobacteraceae bacterium]|nr:hypothetical protein [Paracoccaceae bacterium]
MKMIPGLKRAVTGGGVLWLIALLLLASGGVRLAASTGPALAREVGHLMAGTEAEDDHETPLNCAPQGDIGTVLQALQARERELDRREAALADRIAALSLAEQEIARNLAALETAEQELASTLAIADTAAEDDLARLTAVYENMKPKEAAALFEEMAPEFAAGFLGRMRADAAAAVMAGLEAPTAYSISVILAGRNANVPTD